MNGIKWFKFNDALEAIEYDDIGKLMLTSDETNQTGEII
jgi:hypothetical protein